MTTAATRPYISINNYGKVVNSAKHHAFKCQMSRRQEAIGLGKTEELRGSRVPREVFKEPLPGPWMILQRSEEQASAGANYGKII